MVWVILGAIAIIAIVVLIRASGAKADRKPDFAQARRADSKVMPRTLATPSAEWRVVRREGYPREIAGEAYYQPALITIFGPYKRELQTRFASAELVPEPDNEHDANAVRVEINGLLVGRLSRIDALKYRDSLKGHPANGARISVDARVVGGAKTNQHDFKHYNVELAMPWPLKVER